VARQVVHDHEVSGAQFGNEHLRDIGLEGIAVEGTIEHEGRNDPVDPQSGDEGGGLPVSVGYAGPEALPAR